MATIKTKSRTPVKRKAEPKKDLVKTYNAFKEFEGKKYTGMKVGRSHKWYYDQGEWKEKKITPDEWEFNYGVTKRRAGKAPEGSGVPVGTEYHWYILAHQNVRKLNANDYSTAMSGMKIKLAHKRFDKETWSASDNAQRKRLIKIFQRMIAQLEQELQESPGRSKKAATDTSATTQRGNGQLAAKENTGDGQKLSNPKLSQNGRAVGKQKATNNGKKGNKTATRKKQAATA